MDHAVLPTNYHACLYSPAAKHHRPLAGTHFTVSRKVEGWVDLAGWLHTEIKCRLRKSNPDTVTHSSTNRAQRRLNSLINTKDATTTPRRHRWRSPPTPTWYHMWQSGRCFSVIRASSCVSCDPPTVDRCQFHDAPHWPRRIPTGRLSCTTSTSRALSTTMSNCLNSSWIVFSTSMHQSRRRRAVSVAPTVAGCLSRLVMSRDAIGDWSDASVEPNRRPTDERSMRHEQQLALPSQTRTQTVRRRYWRLSRHLACRARPTSRQESNSKRRRVTEVGDRFQCLLWRQTVADPPVNISQSWSGWAKARQPFSAVSGPKFTNFEGM